MKLWLLRPIDPKAGPWCPWYDKAFGFVIRAATQAAARKVADENAADENDNRNHPWLNPTLSTCTELRPEGAPGLVLRDFAAA